MSNIAHITPHLRNVEAPAAIRDLPAWVIWRFEAVTGGGKPRKVPYYANGGKRHGEQGAAADVAHLVTFDAAKAAAARRGFDGVGFATLSQFGICALDFDNCITDGKIHPDIDPLLLDTYAEFSPSGQGIRAFFRGDLGNGKSIKREPYGMECFSSKGFVTFTGNTLDIVELMGNTDSVALLPGAVHELHARRFEKVQAPVEAPARGVEPVWMDETQIADLMSKLDPDMNHDEWLSVGMGLHHETQGQDAGFDYWDEWSATSSKYPGRDALLQRWASFGRHNDRTVTIRTAMKLAGISAHGAAGADEFEVLVGEASEPAQEADKPLRFQIIPAHEFAAGAPPTWVIKGVLPDAELVVMYGASGSGKSFMALDMAGAISRGIPWRGKKTRKGRVAYIAAEGAGGFRKRLTAYGQHHGIDLKSLDIGVIHAAPNMMEKADAAAIAKSVKAWGGADIIIVDTFAQVMPGANENAGEDVGKALTHCKRINETTGAMILLIHHAGKDAAKGARGWSGLRAAADAELEITRDGEARALKLTKSKDGEDGMVWGFALETIQIGIDEDIEPITSCVVVEGAVPAVGGVARKLGPIEQAVMAAVNELTAKGKMASKCDVISLAAERLPKEEGKRDRRPESAKRSITKLADDGFFILDGEFIESNGVEEVLEPVVKADKAFDAGRKAVFDVMSGNLHESSLAFISPSEITKIARRLGATVEQLVADCRLHIPEGQRFFVSKD